MIDEAYIDYATLADGTPAGLAASFIPRLAAHPNVLVLRTFSKSYSMAGAVRDARGRGRRSPSDACGRSRRVILHARPSCVVRTRMRCGATHASVCCGCRLPKVTLRPTFGRPP